MTFTGTLIEDLMASVERAERRARSDAEFVAEPMLVEPSLVEPSIVEPWFASAQETADYDPKLLGVV